MSKNESDEMLKRALLVVKKLEEENKALKLSIEEPIAIIGMGCRFPGNVNSPEEFWDLMITNKEAITEVPPSRWNVDDYYDPDKEAPGKMYVRKGGFLENPLDEFDAEFFHISPREALDMDPQQRFALEVAYNAIENAGINPSDLMESLTGVYMGICASDYGFLLRREIDLIGKYWSTGYHNSVLSGRIAYFFGLQGPAISMDTACSSSLVAVDTAVNDLRLKHCNLALAGGVNLILAPETSVNFCKSGMLSPEGQCKSFDESADGYVRSEGCAIVVLKRLSDAIADKNTVLAIIRNTAVNQDGPSSGLTVPNGLAQEKVIQAVLKSSKILPAEVSYIEAHGTGTALGDPIELEALKNTYGKDRQQDNPLLVGSVKTNIGHTETVSGVASLMKVVLSLVHEKIPASLHFKKINPHVDLSNTAIQIANKNTDWKRGKKRLAGINSFGFSGTNVHALIEEGPALNEIEFSQWKERSFQLHEFHRQRYWGKAAMPRLQRNLKSVHPLLGEKTIISNGEIIYQGELNLQALSYLEDHQVYAYIIYPAAGYLEMMLASSFYALGESEIHLSNISIEAALSFDENKSIRTQVLMVPTDSGYEIGIYSQTRDADPDNAPWHCHARGMFEISKNNNIPAALDIENIKSRCPKVVSQKDFYGYVNSTGIVYGEHFQTLKNINVGEKEALGELEISSILENYFAHPTLLDGALQLIVLALWNENSKDLYLPIGCEGLELYAPLEKSLFAHWKETEKSLTGRTANITLCSLSGKILVKLMGMQYRKTTEFALRQMLAHENSIEDWMYEWNWHEKSVEDITIPEPAGHWLLFCDGNVSDELKKILESKGATFRCISVENHPRTKEDFVTLLQAELFTGVMHVSSSGEILPLTSDNIAHAQTLGTKSVLQLVQALVQIEETLKIPLYIITQRFNVAQGPLHGLFKTMFAEHPELSITLFDLAASWNPELLGKLLFDKSEEHFYSLQGNRCYVPRFLKMAEAKLKQHELTRPMDDQFCLQSAQKGLLENLILAPLKLKENLAPHDIEVEMRAVGLNFRDVLDALGLYPGEAGPLGGDGAGIITRVGKAVSHLKIGDEILGMISGSLARKALVHENNIIQKPSALNFAEASALPTVFLTAYYAFTRSTVLKKGETVLIHAGAGGVGQAAIQVAKYFGASIIATAGDEKKRDFLRSEGIEAIFDSRSLSYGNDIEKLTKGKGVDVVLNCLSGEGFIETTVGICKKGARFLEIGKRNIWTKEEMKTRRPDMDYEIIALDDISQSHPEIIQVMLKELMHLFDKNSLKPLPITIFPIENSIQAFDYMRAAKHIGKVVIEIPTAKKIENIIHSNASYLITGGLGGLGLTLVKWLAEVGASEIVLVGRRPLDDEIKTALIQLETNKAHITYQSLDIGDEKSMEELLNNLQQSEKPLKGIFHLAGILDDASLVDQDWDHFEKVFRPKVYGSFYLHRFSKNLDLFVMFSSIASSLGNPGQSNYSAANAFMDALCEYRQQQGLPAHSLSWGPWSEVGMAKDLVAQHAKSGFLGLKPRDGMRGLEVALLSSHGQITIANIHWKNYMKKMLEAPIWLEAFIEEKLDKIDLRLQLEAVPANERLQLLNTFVTNELRSVLGLSASQTVDEQKGFFDMGLDSLMAVELKNRLQSAFGKTAILSTNVIFNHSSLESLVNHLGLLLKLEGALPINEMSDVSKKEKMLEEKINKSVGEMSIDEIRKQFKTDGTK